jgi:hypothetical protein
MADVLVASETTNDVTLFIRGLEISQQALDTFAQYANNLKIAPQIIIDANAVTTQTQAMFAKMQADAAAAATQLSATLSAMTASINLTVNTTQAQAQINALLASVTSINITLNAPSAAQIGADIGQAAGQAFLNAVVGWHPTVTGGGGGGGGGGGHHGGGGRANIGGLPIGRGISAMMLLHQVIGFAEGETRATEERLNAGGDDASQLKAEIEARKVHDQMFFGVGYLGRKLGETVFSGGGTTDELEADLRNIKQREGEESRAKERVKLVRLATQRADEENAPTEQERRRLQEEHRRENTQLETREKFEGQRSQVENEYKQQIAAADVEGEKWAKGSEALGYHKAEGERMRKAAENARMAALDRIGSEETKATSANLAAAEADRIRQENKDKLADRKAEATAHAAKLRATGDVAGADVVMKGIEREERQFEADQASPAAAIAMREQNKAEQTTDEAKAAYTKGTAEFESRRTVADIQAEATETTQRATGQGRTAGNTEYKRKLQEEIDEQLQRAKDPTDAVRASAAAAKAKALQDAMPTKLAARDILETGSEARQDLSTQQKIADIKAEADEAMRRAQGDTQGAAESSLSRTIDDRTASLRATASDPKTAVEERKRLNDEAVAEEESKLKRISALREQYARSDAKEVIEIEEKANEDSLQAEGRYYDAELAARHAHYKKLLDAAKEAKQPQAVIDAIQQEEKAADKLDEKKRKREIDHLTEEAREQEMRNKHQGEEANVLHLEKSIQEQLADAAGDPAKTAAIKRKANADLDKIIVGEKHATETDARSMYFDLQKQVLEGKGGDHFKAVQDAKDAKRLLNLGALDPETATSQHPKKPGEELTEASGKMGEAGDKISKAADLIYDTFSNFEIV